jgi:hypothetical protein
MKALNVTDLKLSSLKAKEIKEFRQNLYWLHSR